jgi:hypothetical protein
VWLGGRAGGFGGGDQIKSGKDPDSQGKKIRPPSTKVGSGKNNITFL